LTTYLSPFFSAVVAMDSVSGLQAQLAAGDLRQVFLLLLLAAVAQERPHRVHLGVAGAAIGARRMDFLQDRRSRRKRQSAAAVFLGNQRSQQARLRHRRDEFRRIGAVAVELAPVLAGKAGAKCAGGVANGLEFGILGRGTGDTVKHARLSMVDLSAGNWCIGRYIAKIIAG
jgi:hypothetical protein